MNDWNERWERGETPWDKGAPAPPLLEFLETGGADLVDGARVLVPGCGSGHDVRALAAAGARVTGLDVSEKAIEIARAHPPVAGERYEVGDFFEWRDEAFDLLWEHTCFCAIEPADRPRYAAAAIRLVRPGGHLVGVFFLNPWDPGEIPEPPPHGATRAEIEACLARGFTKLCDRVPTRSYMGREGREWLATFDRHPDNRRVAAT